MSTEEASIGHNSQISKEARDRLKQYIDRIERLTEEKQGLADDIRDIKKEAKSADFDTKALNDVLKMRKKESSEVVNHTGLVETYCRALGMSSYLE